MKWLFLLLTLMAFPALAQNSDAPLEISADGTLEWLQKEQQYLAKGNVTVTQGTLKVQADQIVADYIEADGEENKITLLTASGSVIINNQDTILTSDKATYDVETGQAIATGSNLKLKTDKEEITARDRMTYNNQTGKAEAIGNARITQGARTLKGQNIIANFTQNNEGEQTLSKATVTGGITIQTPDEIITGDQGAYNANTNLAEVMGNVRLVRGPNTLEGERAEVNLQTNVSKIFGNPQKQERVKAVLFPNSTKEETKSQ